MLRTLLLLLFSNWCLAQDYVGQWKVSKIQCTEPSGLVAKSERHTCRANIVPKTVSISLYEDKKILTLKFDRQGSFYFSEAEIDMQEKIETLPVGKEIHLLNLQNRFFQYGNDFLYDKSPIGAFKSNLRVVLEMKSDKAAMLSISDAVFTMEQPFFGELFLKHSFIIQLLRD